MVNTRAILATTALSAALLTGALLPYGPGGAAHAAPSLSAFALKKSDLPAGYTQTKNANETIQQFAQNSKVSVATVRSHGWVGTYDASFLKSFNKTTASEVESGVDLFKSASGATWDLNQGIAAFKKQYPHATTFSAPGIGNQASGLKGTTKSGGTNLTFVLIGVRRGAYLGGVILVGAGGAAATPTTADALKYARIMDGRLKNA
jgi:hypothetical protein